MVYLLFDIDWASDEMIDYVADILIEKNICATWFVTHDSPAIERLKAHPDIFDLGIHPNFNLESTQGKNPEKILDNLLQIIPNAKFVRTHGLLQSTNLLALMASKGLVADFSLYLPRQWEAKPHELYFENGNKIIRVPFHWEDDLEMCRPDRLFEVNLLPKKVNSMMFAFHPVHVFYNTCYLANYRHLSKTESEMPTQQSDDSNDFGSRTFLLDLIESKIPLKRLDHFRSLS
ncbi:MAG: hypothetical protein ABII18_09795 [bacterium]